MSRSGGGQGQVTVQVAAGRISVTKRLLITSKGQFTSWVGEVNGPSAGGGLSRSEMQAC